jgi:hypothetical protein
MEHFEMQLFGDEMRGQQNEEIGHRMKTRRARDGRDGVQRAWSSPNVFLAVFLAGRLMGGCFLSHDAFAAWRTKEPQLGPGYTKEFAAKMEDVLEALNEVLADQTIHGTLVFDKQPVLTGAIQVDSTPLFATWTQPGKVFYKIRKEAISPRHFLESSDQGTIAVRYIVAAVGEERVRLHIDAIYVESTRRTVHISDGTVEASEGKAIEDRLKEIQADEEEAYEANRRRESAILVRETQIRQREEESTRLAADQSSVQDLEQQVNTLRHDLERRIKAPGADLKAAPFHASANVANLRAFTEVIVVIVTPHWMGIEAPDGQRGWIRADELEPLP